ncbi:MAG TPA: hypothetical protein VNX21_06865 [Candidatus Thermoplasmatota archaeon]|nr:hypothetical protein [Candidatus Thermoplasmatota archaeon]
MQRRSRDRRASLRATEGAILGLAVVALLVPLLTGQRSPEQAAFHAGTAPAVLIVVLTLVHAWARRSGNLSSSKYLAMFTMVLAAWMALSGFILREAPAYAWTMLVVGGLVFAAALVEAVLSPPSREGRRPLDPRTQV